MTPTTLYRLGYWERSRYIEEQIQIASISKERERKAEEAKEKNNEPLQKS